MAGISHSVLNVVFVIFIATFASPVSSQVAAPCQDASCAGTVSVGTLIGSCVAVLIGTLLVELGIYLCYRHLCNKPCSKITSSDSDVSSVDGLRQPKDYHAASWSYRGGGPKQKEKVEKVNKKTEVYNISQSKTEEDKVMFAPGLYRTSLEPSSKGRSNVIVNGADNYQPEFPSIYSYNSAWDNRVDHILNKHDRYDPDDLSMISIDLEDDQQYPILKAPKDGVGSVDFSSAKFGIHNHGFVSHTPDSISLNSSDNGDISTYRYFTGVNGKIGEMIPMEELDHHHRRPKGSLVTQDNTVIDMEWDDYTDPDTRISIDDNFLIGPPSVSTSEGTEEMAQQHQQAAYDIDSTGNFILRKSSPPERSSSSDEDLYDYGESDNERKMLSEKHGAWTSSFSRATYKAKMGEVTLEREPPPDESVMPTFGTRYRYSTGLRRAKMTAMRAAAAPSSRENDEMIRRQHERALIKRHQAESLSQQRPGSPDIKIGYIKLIRPESYERSPSPEPIQGTSSAPIIGNIRLQRPEVFDRAMYEDSHFRLAPAPGHDEDDDDMMVVYPISGSKDVSCKRCRGEIDTKDSSSQASIERVNASTISETRSGSRRKKDTGVETGVETIGIIRLMQPYESGTMSSTTSKKQVRFKDQSMKKNSSDHMQSSSSYYSGVSTDDELDGRRSPFVRESSRPTGRGSSERRKRRSKSLPSRGPQREDNPLPTIGVIRLVSPDTTSEFDTDATAEFGVLSDQGYSSQASITDRLSHGHDTLDTDDVHTIGVLKLVSPHTSPRLVRSERSQHRTRSPEGRVSSPERRGRNTARRVRSPESDSRPERRVKSMERHGNSESHSITERRVKSLDRHSVPGDRRVKSPSRSRSPDNRVRSPGRRQSPERRFISPERTIGYVTLVSPKPKRKTKVQKDAATEPHVSWNKLLQKLQEHVEEDVAKKSAKRGAPKDVGLIKLKRPEGLVKDSGAQTDKTWLAVMRDVEDVIAEKYQQTRIPAKWPRTAQTVEEKSSEPVVNSVGVIKLSTPVSRKNVRDSATQPDFSWRQMMSEFEDEMRSTLRREQHEPAHAVIKIKQEPVKDLRPAVTQTKSRGSQSHLPWGKLVRKVRDDAMEEYHSKVEKQQELHETRAKKDPTVLGIFKLKGAKEKQQPLPQAIIKLKQEPVKDASPALTQTKSRGSQSHLPWGELVRQIQDDTIEEYDRTIRKQREFAEVSVTKEPTVMSVFKLKGAKGKPKYDSFTQSETVETDEHTTQPDRSWNVILKDMKQILENEYRRTINELEERLAETPKDEPDFAKTSPTVAVFKLKRSPKKASPQTVATCTQSETPQMTDQDTQADKPWSKVVKDVRKILENEYRRTIRELEERLTEPEPENKASPTVAVFKLKETKRAPVLKPDVSDCGTQPAKPWGEILSTVRESVENEYRQIIRELQSQLETPQEEPKAKSLGFFKIAGKKEKAAKAPKKEKATGPMFPWSTVVRNVEDSVGRRLRKQKQYQHIDEETQKPKQLGVITLKSPKVTTKQYHAVDDGKPTQLGVITLKSPKVSTKMNHDVVQVADSSTSPAEPWPQIEELIVPQQVEPVESAMLNFGTEIGIQVGHKVSTSDSNIMCRPAVFTTGSSTTPPVVINQYSQSIPPSEANTATQVRPECVDFTHQEAVPVRDAKTSPISTRKNFLSLSPIEITSKDPEVSEEPKPEPIQETVTREMSTSDSSIMCRPAVATTGSSTVQPIVINQYSQSIPPNEANTGTQVRPEYVDFTHQEAVSVRDAKTSPVFLRRNLSSTSPIDMIEIISEDSEIIEESKLESSRGTVTQEVSIADSSIMCRPAVSTTGSSTTPPVVINQYSQSIPPNEANTATQVRPEYVDFTHQEAVSVRDAKTSPVFLRKNLSSTSPIDMIEIISEDSEVIEESKLESSQEPVTREVSTADLSIMCRPTMSTTGSSTTPPAVINQYSQSIPPNEANTATQVRPEYADFTHQEAVPNRDAKTSPLFRRKNVLSISPIEITSKDSEVIEVPKPEPIQETVTRSEVEPVHTAVNLGVLMKDSCTQYDIIPTHDSVSQYEYHQSSVNIQVEPQTRDQHIETIAKQLHEMAVQMDPILQKNFQIQVSPDTSDNDTMTVRKVTKDSYAYSEDMPMVWKQTQVSPDVKTQGMTTDTQDGLMASTQTNFDVLNRWTQYESDTLDNWVQVATVMRHGAAQTDWKDVEDNEEIIPEEVIDVKAGRYSYMYDSDSGVDTNTQTEPVMIVVDSCSDTDIEVMDSISQTEPGVFFTESDYSDEEIEITDMETQAEEYMTDLQFSSANVQETESLPEMILVTDADAQTYVDVKNIYAQTKPMNVEDRAVNVTAVTHLAQTQTQEIEKDINNTQSQTTNVELVHQSSCTDPAQKSYTFVQTDTKHVVERSASPIDIQTSFAFVQTDVKASVDRAASPIQTQVVDRAASPIQVKVIHRANSPILTPSKELAVQASYATRDVFSQYFADVREGRTQTSPKVTRHKMSSTDRSCMIDSSIQANLTPIKVIQDHITPISFTSVQKTFSAPPPKEQQTRDSSMQHDSPDQHLERVPVRDARVQAEPVTFEVRTQSEISPVIASGAQTDFLEPKPIKVTSCGAQTDFPEQEPIQEIIKVAQVTPVEAHVDFGPVVADCTTQTYDKCDSVEDSCTQTTEEEQKEKTHSKEYNHSVTQTTSQIDVSVVHGDTFETQTYLTSSADFTTQVQPLTIEQMTATDMIAQSSSQVQVELGEKKPPTRDTESQHEPRFQAMSTSIQVEPMRFNQGTTTQPALSHNVSVQSNAPMQKPRRMMRQTVNETFDIGTSTSVPLSENMTQTRVPQSETGVQITPNITSATVSTTAKPEVQDQASTSKPDVMGVNVQVTPIQKNEGSQYERQVQKDMTSQYERLESEDTSIQVKPVTCEQASSPIISKRTAPSVCSQTRVSQYETDVQITPSTTSATVFTTAKPEVQDQAFTSKTYVMEMNVELVPVQKNEGSQITTSSANVFTTAKPEVQDQASTSKPDLMGINIQVFPVQKNERSQITPSSATVFTTAKPEVQDQASTSKPDVMGMNVQVNPVQKNEGTQITPPNITSADVFTTAKPEVQDQASSFKPDVMGINVQVYPVQKNEGSQITPSSANVFTTAKPEVLDQGSTSKPDVMGINIQVCPVQKNEGSQITPSSANVFTTAKPEVQDQSSSFKPDVMGINVQVYPVQKNEGSQITPSSANVFTTAKPEVQDQASTSKPDVMGMNIQVYPVQKNEGSQITPTITSSTVSTTAKPDVQDQASISKPEVMGMDIQVNPVQKNERSQITPSSANVFTTAKPEVQDQASTSKPEVMGMDIHVYPVQKNEGSQITPTITSSTVSTTAKPEVQDQASTSKPDVMGMNIQVYPVQKNEGSQITPSSANVFTTAKPEVQDQASTSKPDVMGMNIQVYPVQKNEGSQITPSSASVFTTAKPDVQDQASTFKPEVMGMNIQVYPVQKNEGSQITPTITSSTVFTTAKPEVQDQASTSKPDVMGMNIQVYPVQKNEGSQITPSSANVFTTAKPEVQDQASTSKPDVMGMNIQVYPVQKNEGSQITPSSASVFTTAKPDVQDQASTFKPEVMGMNIQVYPVQKNEGSQITPTITSSTVSTTAKPEVQDQASTSKPDVMGMNIQVYPVQKNEGSQITPSSANVFTTAKPEVQDQASTSKPDVMGMNIQVYPVQKNEGSQITPSSASVFTTAKPDVQDQASTFKPEVMGMNIQVYPVQKNEGSQITPTITSSTVFTTAKPEVQDQASTSKPDVMGMNIQVYPVQKNEGSQITPSSASVFTTAKPEVQDQASTFKPEAMGKNIQVYPVQKNEGSQITPTITSSTVSTTAKPAVQDQASTYRPDVMGMNIQVYPVQKNEGSQIAPSSASVFTTAKPEVQDQASTSKPDVMGINIQVYPVQMNEGSQYERQEQKDMTSQYERLESEDTAIQVAPVIFEQASSPIISKRKAPSTGTQTDPVDEEIHVSFIEEDIVKEAEIISFTAEPDTSILYLPEDAKDQSTQADIVEELLTLDKSIQYETSLRDTSSQVKPVTMHKLVEASVVNRPKSTQVTPNTFERGTVTVPQHRTTDCMTQSEAVKTVGRSTSPLLTRKNDVAIQVDITADVEPEIEPVQMEQVHASMTMAPSYVSVEKIRLRDEVKEEVREELREEVKTQMRDELMDEVKDVVRMEIQRDVKEVVRREVEDEVRHAMTFIIREELRQDVREEMKTEFESRIRFEMEDRHRSDIEFRLRGELEPKIRMEMEPVIRFEVERELQAQKPVCVNQSTSPVQEVVFSKPTQTSIKTTSRGTYAEKPPANNALIQVEPSTFDRGTTPLDTITKDMSTQALIPVQDKITQFDTEPTVKIVEVTSLPGGPPSNQVSVNIQTEVEQYDEASQATTNHKVSATQYESLYCIDRSLQVQPVMVNQSTSISSRTEDQTDSTTRHQFDMDVEVQVCPTTREDSSSPIPYETRESSTSPYKQPEADYTPAGLDKRSNRLTTLKVATRRVFSPVEEKKPLEETITPLETDLTTQVPESINLENLALSPTTQNLFSRLDSRLKSGVNIRTEAEQCDEATQATANHKVSATQYESLNYIDRTLQVQPVMVNQSTSISSGRRDHTDSSMHHQFDMDVEVQVGPTTREDSSSPLSFQTHERSTSPYDQPEADYTPPGLDKLRSNRPTTLKLGTRRVFSPVEEKTPVVVEETIKPLETNLTTQAPDQVSLESRELSPTTQNLFSRLDYSLKSTSRDPTPESSRQYSYTYTRYDDVPADPNESYTSRFDRDGSMGTSRQQFASTPTTIASSFHSSYNKILPPGTQVVVVQSAPTGYTTAIISNTSSTLTTSLSPGGRPSVFTSLSPILSSESSYTDSSSEDISELECIRRDMGLSEVIITDDPVKLIHFLLNREVYPNRRSTGGFLPRYKPMETSISVLFNDSRRSHHSTDYRHVTPTMDFRRQTTSTTYSSRSLLRISTGSPAASTHLSQFVDNSPFRINVSHDSKGSPRPGNALSPPRSKSPVPPRVTPEQIAKLPIPRGMITRLSDLLDAGGEPIDSATSPSKLPQGPPKFDRSVEDLAEFFDSYEAVDRFFSADKKDAPGSESEPDTQDSDTDSEHWQAVLDLTRPYSSYEDRHYWSDEPGHHSSSESLSEDDNVRVCCTYDLVYPNFSRINTASSSDDELYSPRQSFRRRKPKTQLDSKKLRSELELTEVVTPKATNVTLTGYSPRDTNSRGLSGASWYHSKEKTRSEPDLLSLIRDDQSIPGSPTPSLASSHTTEKLKGRLATAAKGGLVDAESSLDQIRYASLVGNGRSPLQNRGPKFGRFAQLSRSEPDLAAEYSLPSGRHRGMESF